MNEDHSETARYRHLTAPYCHGSGIDVGSGGWPVVPWAIQIELPADKFKWYNQRDIPATVEWQGDFMNLPFKDGVLDFVYSSHLIEDFVEWTPILKEFVRVLKPGGCLVLLVPDRELWNAAIAAGQPPNCEHRHESHVGELSTYAADIGVSVIEDRLTALTPQDYTILFVARKTQPDHLPVGFVSGETRAPVVPEIAPDMMAPIQ